MIFFKKLQLELWQKINKKIFNKNVSNYMWSIKSINQLII